MAKPKIVARAGEASSRAELAGTRSLILNGEMVLYGVVDPFSGSGEGIRAIDVMASLAEVGAQDALTLRLNSPGGSVVEGLAVFNALRAWGKPVTVHVDAMAASVASIIAMAGTRIVMAENATLMIHDPWAVAMGGSQDLRLAADEIDRQKGILVNIYAQRTKLDPAEIEALMSAETYMSASEAVERGFADEVEQPLRVAACAKLDAPTLARLLAPAPLRVEARTPAAPAALPQERQMSHETASAVAGNDAATPPIPAPTPAPANAPTPAVDVNAIRLDAARAERERVSGIYAAVRAARLETSVGDELVRQGSSLDQARAHIIDAWARAQEARPDNPQPQPGTPPQVTVVADAVDRWAQGAERGLLVRAKLVTPTDQDRGNEFVGLTLSELARSSLGVRNIKSGALDRMSMVGRAFTVHNAGPGYHTTSDFPSVLQNVAYRAVMRGYEEVAETFDLWTGVGTATDFRPVSRVDMGLFPGLDRIEEGAEYKYATLGDTGTLVQVATYGKMFAISRQTIVNDDLGFFDRVPRKMGRAAKRTIGNLVYGVLNGNPVMQDGVALFHTAHGNLAGTGAIPSAPSIGALRAMMATQTDPTGATVQVEPRYLLTPPTLRDIATTVVTAENLPGDAGQVPNYVRGAATVISDSRLTGTAWYLAADPAQTDTIEVTYLDGVQEPFLDQKEGWNVDGSEFKVRIDAGVKALHWRGLARNPGA